MDKSFSNTKELAQYVQECFVDVEDEWRHGEGFNKIPAPEQIPLYIQMDVVETKGFHLCAYLNVESEQLTFALYLSPKEKVAERAANSLGVDDITIAIELILADMEGLTFITKALKAPKDNAKVKWTDPQYMPSEVAERLADCRNIKEDVAILVNARWNWMKDTGKAKKDNLNKEDALVEVLDWLDSNSQYYLCDISKAEYDRLKAD